LRGPDYTRGLGKERALLGRECWRSELIAKTYYGEGEEGDNEYVDAEVWEAHLLVRDK
jgi:hypothetical protein